ncbi:MAG: hypothetical protein AcusKO_47770 [Acuticoccus sp.]
MSLIINTPFECPAQHWGEGTSGKLEIKPVRRPASYEVFDARNNTKRTEVLDLVNTIRTRVDQWRADGWPGVTIVTRKLNRPGFTGGHLDQVMPPAYARRAWRSSAPRLRPGNVADRLQEPAMVEPVDPGERRELDSLEGSPRTPPMNDFGLVEAVDCLGESVVVAVADAADGGLDTSLGQALGVANADVLRAQAIRMVHQAGAMNRPSLMQRLLQSVQHEAGMSGPAHPPADDAAGIGVDDEGDVDEARPGRDIGEIREPQPVRCRDMEDPVHMVERAWCRLVLNGRADRPAADHALQTHALHQPQGGAAGNVEPLPHQLSPDLARSIDREVLGEDALDLGLQLLVPLCSCREL